MHLLAHDLHPQQARSLGKRLGGRFDAATFLIVYAFLLFLFPSQLIVPQIGSPGTPASLWAWAGLLWWLGMYAAGWLSGERRPVRIAALGLMLAVLASYASAMARGWYAPADAHQETDEVTNLVAATAGEIQDVMIRAADRGLLTLIAWLGILLIASDALRVRSRVDRVIKGVVTFIAVMAGIGIVQYFSGLEITPFYDIPGLAVNSEFGGVGDRSVVRRVLATAVHPIEFGVVVAAALPLALHRAVHSTRKRTWVPVAILAIAIPMSVSRSAVLVAGVSALVLIASWPPAWRRRAILIAPFVAVGLRFLVPGLLGTVRSLFTNLFNDPSTQGRLDDYDVVFAIYADQPLLGRGLYTFVPEHYRIVDNQFLITLLELGLIGLIALLVFFGTGYLTAHRAYRIAADPELKHLSLALSASIAGIVVSYATFDALSFPKVAGMTFFLIGLAGTAYRLAQKQTSCDEPGQQARADRVRAGES